LVTIETSDFLAQGVDKMAHQARLLFRKLEQLREVVVFIDEVEEFVRERTEAEADRESRLTTTAMLTLLQRFLHNKRAILIFATNHSEVFDRAITRRFDLMVLVKPPNVDSKIALWRERRQNVPPTLLAKEEEALRSNADIVDRFTYDEWATFMEQHEELGRKAAASEGELAPLLRETAAALIIDKREWKRWAKSKSAVR